MTSNNLGPAVLLVAVLWFGQNGWAWWHYLLALFAIGTWAIATGADEAKDLMRAKARYYETRTADLVSNRKPRTEE